MGACRSQAGNIRLSDGYVACDHAPWPLLPDRTRDEYRTIETVDYLRGSRTRRAVLAGGDRTPPTPTRRVDGGRGERAGRCGDLRDALGNRLRRNRDFVVDGVPQCGDPL